MWETKYELYQTTPSVEGSGMFYFTECGNMMYHIGNDPMIYHNKICPKCMYENPYTTVILILAGTPEGKKIYKERRKHI